MLSLPNNDNEEEESDAQDAYYAPVPTFLLRITPPEDYPDTFGFLQRTMLEYVGDSTIPFLIAEEISVKGVLHYHIVCKPGADSLEDFKDWARESIMAVLYPPPRARGFGIKQWHCTEADNVDRAIAYALKCAKVTKRFWYSGYKDEYIEKMKSESFTKSDRPSFSIDFLALKKRFEESNMTIEEFMEHFIMLKAKHQQMVNLTHAYQYALSSLIARDPSQSQGLVRSFMNKNHH